MRVSSKNSTASNLRLQRTFIERAFQTPHLYYELPGQWTLLVGASDADNDYLSLEVAQPADWWFHADKVPGSHVILRAKTDEEPSAATLRQAASVAGYHSKARNGRIPVHCTRARYVPKPRGVKPGPSMKHGKTLKVRPDISFATRKRSEN